MARVLIIAYGNPLRSDDGLAWRVADLLEGKFPAAEVEILRLHQLAPEVAETVSRSSAVIFVDAAHESGDRPGDMRFEPIPPSVSEARFTHHLSPNAVVGLAKQLYGASPQAFAATIAGQNFEHGESLSPEVAGALPSLVGLIETLVQKVLGSGSIL